MEKTLLIHHFERLWENEMIKNHNIDLDSFSDKIINFLENSGERFDNIIITRFEDDNFDEEHIKFINFCKKNKIKLKLEIYGYGWDIEDSFFDEEKEGLTWCKSGRKNRDDEDILLIDEWQKNLINNDVTLIGTFDEQCINDIETVFDCLQINYKRNDGLIVGSGVDYKWLEKENIKSFVENKKQTNKKIKNKITM